MEGARSMKGGMWVMLAMMAISVLIVGARAGNVVINESEAPISIQQASVNAVNNNESTVVVAQNTTMELPEGFADASVMVRNEATGGVFGPISLSQDDAMLVQSSSSGSVTNVVSVLLGTVVEGTLTALRKLVDDL
ncbi:hypothetical protein GOP47_0011905 [Adiantum capillus-veneris]|uniref:Uncharacterized protein n=1 Tax=Adiantum capillus-veneris TaxID=13818 RepID=A0A9D4UU37_ADICA|nr:hypothetical protein GOP47_0011905 [Adiantum capillus-veneris]